MVEPDTAARRHGRGRRPLAAVRAEVLDAAAELLFDQGLSATTIERVSRISGVSRSTIHKHWASRGALTLDAYIARVGPDIAFVDTGDIDADLAHVLVQFVGLMADGRSCDVFAQLIGAAQTDRELGIAFEDHYFGPRRREALAMLNRAVKRGQLPAGGDLPTAVDMLWGACYKRLLLPNLRADLTVGFAEQVVAYTLTGLRSSAPMTNEKKEKR